MTNITDISEQLANLPCFKQAIITKIAPLNEGLSRCCYQVFYDNDIALVKSLMTTASTAKIEAQVQMLAAAADLSSKVIYADTAWLINEYLIGENLNQLPRLETKSKIDITLTLLANFHQLSVINENKAKSAVNEQIFNIKTTCLSLIHSTLIPDVEKKIIEKVFNDIYSPFLRQLTTCAIQNVLCHGDANFSNVIRCQNEQGRVDHKLIDFECATLAPIEYDLAMLMAINHLELSELHYIKAQYLSATNMKNVKLDDRLVTRYYFLSLLINGLWYYIAYINNNNEKYYRLQQKQFTILSDYYPKLKLMTR